MEALRANGGVDFSRLPRTKAGIYPAASHGLPRAGLEYDSAISEDKFKFILVFCLHSSQPCKAPPLNPTMQTLSPHTSFSSSYLGEDGWGLSLIPQHTDSPAPSSNNPLQFPLNKKHRDFQPSVFSSTLKRPILQATIHPKLLATQEHSLRQRATRELVNYLHIHGQGCCGIV